MACRVSLPVWEDDICPSRMSPMQKDTRVFFAVCGKWDLAHCHYEPGNGWQIIAVLRAGARPSKPHPPTESCQWHDGHGRSGLVGGQATG